MLQLRPSRRSLAAAWSHCTSHIAYGPTRTLVTRAQPRSRSAQAHESALDALGSVRNQPWQSAAWVLSGAGAQCRCDQRAQAAWAPAEGRAVCPETTNVMFDGQVSARDLPRQQAGWCRIGARMRVPRPTGAMRHLWAIRARASQLGRSAPCTRGTTASDTRNLSSIKSCGSEPVRARSVRPQSMSTRRSAALSRRTCSPSRALQDCCGDHPQPMQTEAARARARSTTRAHCARSYQAKDPRRSYRKGREGCA